MASTIKILSPMSALYFKNVEKNGNIELKKIYLGFDTVPFVGHELDSTGINMSQKRVQSTINFAKPVTLTELYSFLGLVNYFRDHIPQHSSVAHSLHNMVSEANKQKSKKVVWTTVVTYPFSYDTKYDIYELSA